MRIGSLALLMAASTIQTAQGELLVNIEPNLKNGKCLKAAGEGEMVELASCDETKANQQWIMDDVDGSQLRSKANPNLCIAMSLLVKECKDSSESNAEKQMWQYLENKGWIRNKFSGLCMNPIHSNMLGSCSPVDEDEVKWTLRNVNEDDDEPEEKPEEEEEEPTVCPQDVMECWDGSYVGRNPKMDCDFNPCPEELPGANTQTAYQIDLYDEGEYCLTAGFFGVKGKLKIKHCDETNVKAQWILDDDTKTIRPAAKPHLCVEVGRIVDGKSLRLNTCRDKRKKKQQWHWRINGFGGSDPIRSDLRRDMCIYHTTSGTVKLGFAATHCVLPMSKMQWAFHEIEVGPEVVNPKPEEPQETEPEEPEGPEPPTEKSLKDCSWQKIEPPETKRRFGHHAHINGDSMVVTFLDRPVKYVYVYKLNANGKWRLDQKVGDSDVEFGDGYGFQYADISLNGKYLAITGKEADSDGRENNGVVLVYEKDDDGKYRKVAHFEGEEEGDLFGNNIALTGDTLLVGARRADNDRGAVYAYRRNGQGQWKRYGSKLVAFDGKKGDMLGRRINYKGQTAVIASLSNGDAKGFGDGKSIYVFDDDRGNGSDDGRGFSETQKLLPHDPDDLQSFGFKIDIDSFSKPPTIVIGAKRKNGKGVAYVFTRKDNGKWIQSAKLKPSSYYSDAAMAFGSDVAVEGDIILINGLSEEDSGLVYMFQRNGLEWRQPFAPWTGKGFGDSLDISRNTAAIGAPGEDGDSGAVYMVDFCEE